MNEDYQQSKTAPNEPVDEVERILERRRHSSDGVTFLAVLVQVLSVAGILFHSFICFMCAMMAGLSDGATKSATQTCFSLSLPFAYFIFCFVTSFPAFKGSSLLVSGIIANLCLVLFAFSFAREGAGGFAFYPFFLAPFWLCMCMRRMKSKPTSLPTD